MSAASDAFGSKLCDSTKSTSLAEVYRRSLCSPSNISVNEERSIIHLFALDRSLHTTSTP